MNEFWTSDDHFGHRNIIGYCGRPFLRADGQFDLDAMHRELILRWNAVVGPRDTVFHLGDFSMASNVSQIFGFRKKLNGRIVLVRGNHDQSTQKMQQAGFDEVHDRLLIERKGLRIYMAHVPFTINTEAHRNRKYRSVFVQPPPEHDIWLCGHVHEKWRRRGNVINVGVDQWDFTPRTLEVLLAAKDEQ